MKFLKEFSEWNPDLNKKVLDYIETNKSKLGYLWDSEKSEEENMDFLINYFTEYPDEMKSKIDLDRVTSPSSQYGLKNSSPTLQNIGGVKDFKSF